MVAIVTVVYHETKEHFNMARRTWASMPADSEIVAVVNKKLPGYEYPGYIHYIDNDENCLAKAWNIGLKYFFDKGYEAVFVSGLDSECVDEEGMMEMEHIALTKGFAAACGLPQMWDTNEHLQHGDSGFSFFCISKELFEKVGDFDENFKPAYFEDDDYLERMLEKNYWPTRMPLQYLHITQGTIKYGSEVSRLYPEFMQKNLEYYKYKYGVPPRHLPEDIVFYQS